MNQPLLAWSDQLALGLPAMDQTHREFVDLLNQVADADDGNLLSCVDEFIDHTQSHFDQEERWMEACRFPPLHCHRGEHQRILETASEVRRRIAGGDLKLGRALAEALAEWFPRHAGSMDAILAYHMTQTGYLPSP